MIYKYNNYGAYGGGGLSCSESLKSVSVSVVSLAPAVEFSLL